MGSPLWEQEGRHTAFSALLSPKFYTDTQKKRKSVLVNKLRGAVFQREDGKSRTECTFGDFLECLHHLHTMWAAPAEYLLEEALRKNMMFCHISM